MASERRRAVASSLLSPRRLGDLNRSRVLRALTDHGPLSRSDLAKAAGVTRATMGTIVQSLIDAGLLEEHDAVADGTIGKPARPVWFAPGAGLAVAVSVTGDGATACLVDAVGTAREHEYVAFRDRESPRAVADAIVKVARSVRGKGEPVGVGVSIPGVCDTAAGEVLGSGQVPGAAGRRIHDSLAAATGLPVYVDNDSRTLALAERWFGAGRGRDTFASLQTGSGLGVGLVLDSVIVRSHRGAAGEVGHTCVVPGGERCTCGLYGCWETIATLRWLRREARAAHLAGAATMTCERLSALAAESSVAEDLLRRYAANLSIGIANLNQILSLELFILHGDVVGGGEAFRQRLEADARARALTRLSLEFSTLEDAALLGASALVLSEKFQLVA